MRKPLALRTGAHLGLLCQDGYPRGDVALVQRPVYRLLTYSVLPMTTSSMDRPGVDLGLLPSPLT